MIESHDALLDAVHAHEAVVVIVTGDPPPPAAGADAFVGEISKAQGAASCVTVKVWPAIMSVPVRAAPVFAATAYRTVPSPAPLAPDDTVIHSALLAAVHEHAEAVVTST